LGLLFTPKEVAAGGNDKPFIRPAPHKSPLFRSVAILYTLLFAIYRGSTAAPPGWASLANATLQRVGRYLVLPPNAAAMVHLLLFSIWFGTVVCTTFVAGIAMFKNLPRRVFGTLQSKLFPLYFWLCSVMIGVQEEACVVLFPRQIHNVPYCLVKYVKYISSFWDFVWFSDFSTIW
jgi:hypothetical protein